jgi:hypothetical protein
MFCHEHVYMKIKLILLLAIALMFQPKVHAQKLEFDIIWLGKIGKLHIQRTADEDSTFTSINSVVKIPFYKLTWATTLTTSNGELTTSNYQQLLNDNKREFTEITMKADNLWQLTDNEGKKETITIRHLFYVSDLYFKEPVNEAYIFSERFGRSLPIVNNGNGHYTLMLPDDNDCEYFYENGLCKMVKAKNGSRTIKMVLNEAA